MAKSNILNLGDVQLAGTHLKLSSFLDFEPPITDGLTDIYIIGGSKELSTINRVSGETTAVVSGAPTFNSEFGGVFNWSNHINLNKLPHASQTLITISKPKITANVAATENAIISNRAYETKNGVSTLVGDGLAWLRLPQLQGQFGTNSTSASNAVATTIDSTKWAAAFSYVDATTLKARTGYKQGLNSGWGFKEATLNNRDASSTSRTLRIGATALNTNSEQVGDSEVGLVMIYNKALTQAQILEVVDYIAAYLNDAFGINDL